MKYSPNLLNTYLTVALAACAGQVAPCNSCWAQANDAAPAVTDYPQKNFHSFKGDLNIPPDFQYVGAGAESFVHFEAEGLRIKLPSGRPHQAQGVGADSRFAVTGDFELTVSYEILAEPKVEDAGKQTRLSLRAVLQKPGTNMATNSRSVMEDKGVVFNPWRSLKNPANGKNEQRAEAVPASGGKAGRLRMVRTGSTIAYHAAESENGPFRLLKEFPFAPDPAKVGIAAGTGGPLAVFDVRIIDFLVRYGATPAATEPNQPMLDKTKSGLAVALLVALIVTLLLGLGIWLLFRARRNQESAPTVTEGEK
jgi:hypothetical protein